MLRIAIAGCGHAARVHVARLTSSGQVQVVGCADRSIEAARSLADSIRSSGGGEIEAFVEPRDLFSATRPDAVAIFTPHLTHYRLAMDALQAGCHVFVEKPLTTNAQEAADIATLARARSLTVGVGHQYRLAPSLVEARKRVASGELGALRLLAATMAAPWLASHAGPEDSWRLDPKAGGTGVLADLGDHVLDASLWTTGLAAAEVAAFQARTDEGLDVVTAAAIRLSDGTPATLAVSGVSPVDLFELTLLGERGTLRVGPRHLEWTPAGESSREVELPATGPSIDDDFVSSIASGRPPCCPVEEALDTVRLLEAIGRSAASGQVVRVA